MIKITSTSQWFNAIKFYFSPRRKTQIAQPSFAAASPRTQGLQDFGGRERQHRKRHTALTRLGPTVTPVTPSHQPITRTHHTGQTRFQENSEIKGSSWFMASFSISATLLLTTNLEPQRWWSTPVTTPNSWALLAKTRQNLVTLRLILVLCDLRTKL